MTRNTGNPPGRIVRWQRAQVLPFRTRSATQAKKALQEPAKASKMPVAEVSRDMLVKADHVYLIPPRCNSDISAGFLWWAISTACWETLLLPATPFPVRDNGIALQHVDGVFSMIKRLGGRMLVESEARQGARFQFTIPARNCRS
jgi:hypothetical protein